MIINTLKDTKVGSILIALSKGTVHRFSVISFDTETRLALCIIYAEATNETKKEFRWMTTHVHPNGRYEFLFCKKPDSETLNNLIKVQHPTTPGMLYCQEMQLDYITYPPDKAGDLPYEIVDALARQGSVESIKLR